jgi:hypothetical protein
MKKTIKVLPIIAGIILISCGGESSLEKLNEISTELNEASKEITTGMDVTMEMALFLDNFDGTSEAVAKSLKEYGATDEIKEHFMGWANLDDPTIVSQKGNCYKVNFKIEEVEGNYEICWENKKIVSITGG